MGSRVKTLPAQKVSELPDPVHRRRPNTSQRNSSASSSVDCSKTTCQVDTGPACSMQLGRNTYEMERDKNEHNLTRDFRASRHGDSGYGGNGRAGLLRIIIGRGNEQMGAQTCLAKNATGATKSSNKVATSTMTIEEDSESSDSDKQHSAKRTTSDNKGRKRRRPRKFYAFTVPHTIKKEIIEFSNFHCMVKVRCKMSTNNSNSNMSMINVVGNIPSVELKLEGTSDYSI